MSSFATFRASPFSFPSSSTTGETMWHGTHHSAQKSTSTGVVESSTFCWNSASVTSPMFAISFVASDLAGSRRWSVVGVLQEPLGVDRRLAALPGGRDGLPVRPVGHVARGEDAGDVRRGARLVD